MQGHITNTVLAVVHKTITGPKFNCRTVQKQLDWKDWLEPEWIQLDNYAKQNMFGTPCTAPIDASIFFWVWLHSIKPHENDRKKVRGICDGSTCGGKTMVHGATCAPTPQQIDVHLQIALSAFMGVYLWHADVPNAFAKADCPEQIYYMRCDRVFQDWWADGHPDISLPLDGVVPVLKNLQGRPEGPPLCALHFHSVIITIKFKNTTHAPCLYHCTFNDEFVLFL
jgi:hypothetical protein